jgi:hypothetical protein
MAPRTFDERKLASSHPTAGPKNIYQSGVRRKYPNRAGPARTGAVTHAGPAKEVVCYADI